MTSPVNNRIDRRFAALRAAGRTGLIPFVTAGDPLPEATVPVLHALVEAGADLIELGVPFSDPMADGPVIQKSSERAVQRGIGTVEVLAMVREFRDHDVETPIVLMGYLNPIEIYGRARFAAEAAAAGVDGLLLVDAPLEEAPPVQALLAEHGLHQILLAAPTTHGERLQRLTERAGGFLYYVAFAGVTGASHLDAGSVRDRVMAIQARTATPVAVGFGIKNAQSARELAGACAAIVVGSALVEHLAGCADAETAAEDAAAFLRPLRAALDEGLADNAAN